jgi:hypothetical protein
MGYIARNFKDPKIATDVVVAFDDVGNHVLGLTHKLDDVDYFQILYFLMFLEDVGLRVPFKVRFAVKR